MTQNLEIRPAIAEDLPAIVSLLADDALGKTREDPGEPTKRAYLEAFAAIQRDENQLLAVAVSAGEVVGCLQLSFIPGLSRRGMWRGQIESVRIAAAQRGGGLGRVVLLQERQGPLGQGRVAAPFAGLDRQAQHLGIVRQDVQQPGQVG